MIQIAYKRKKCIGCNYCIRMDWPNDASREEKAWKEWWQMVAFRWVELWRFEMLWINEWLQSTNRLINSYSIITWFMECTPRARGRPWGPPEAKLLLGSPTQWSEASVWTPFGALGWLLGALLLHFAIWCVILRLFSVFCGCFGCTFYLFLLS